MIQNLNDTNTTITHLATNSINTLIDVQRPAAAIELFIIIIIILLLIKYG